MTQAPIKHSIQVDISVLS